MHVAFYKTLFFGFWFRPLSPKIYSPKFFMGRVWQKQGNLCTQRLACGAAWHYCDVITYHRSWVSMARHTCPNSIKGTTMLANEICTRRGDLVAYRWLVSSIFCFVPCGRRVGQPVSFEGHVKFPTYRNCITFKIKFDTIAIFQYTVTETDGSLILSPLVYQILSTDMWME